MQTQGLVDDPVEMRHRTEFPVVGEVGQRLQLGAELGDLGGVCCEVVKEEDHGRENCFTAWNHVQWATVLGTRTFGGPGGYTFRRRCWL